MIQINLLPVRARKKKESVRQFVSIYLLSVVFALSAIGYIWISQSKEIEILNKRLTQVQQEVSKYAKYEAMLKEMQKQKEIIDKKRTVIQNLQKDRDAIARIFALLSIQVPPDKMWFERFSQTANSITLEGIALSNEAVAEFMRNLESSPFVIKGSVNLTHSRQTLISNVKLREFHIVYRFLPFSEVQKQLKAQGS